jgi:glutathione synthase
MKLALLMDSFDRLAIHRDSSLMIIEAALARGMEVYIFDLPDILLEGETPFAHVKQVTFCDIRQAPDWYRLAAPQKMPLTDFHSILIRKDPPFDIDYVFLTYLMQRAQHAGVHVVNTPQAIRDFNEKLIIFNFPECIAPTLVSCHKADIRAFWEAQGDIVLKPLDGMAGRSVFRVQAGDTNFTTMVELLTQQGTRHIMAQRYLPAIREGDKRILILHGKTVPMSLARLPKADELRASMTLGGGVVPQPLSERDEWITAQVEPFLLQHGILLAGLDIIGDYMTEINITSPTCMRELSQATGQNLADVFLDGLLNPLLL